MEKLWTTGEVARWLGIQDVDVEQLVRDGKLAGYKLGGQFLRFRPSDVKRVQATTRFRRAAGPRRGHATQSRWAQLADFLYFYDFYVVSVTLLAVLVVYLIASG